MRSMLSALLGLALFGTLQPLAAQGTKTGQATAQGTVRFVLDNEIWQPGQQFKTGRDWLALGCEAKGCTLEPATLTVKQEFWQGHYDDKPRSGQHLSFKRTGGSDKPVVAWFQDRAAPASLKPGDVATYFSPQHPLKQPIGRGSLEAIVDLPDGEPALLVPMLQRQWDPNKDEGSPYRLQLRAQGKRQMLLGYLGTCSGTFHPRTYLQWAGDLDRDGKPDFIVSFVDADGPVHLYLSSAARPGQLVGLAGVFDSPPFGGECDGAGGWVER
jgi:hypothetical protein